MVLRVPLELWNIIYSLNNIPKLPKFKASRLPGAITSVWYLDVWRTLPHNLDGKESAIKMILRSKPITSCRYIFLCLFCSVWPRPNLNTKMGSKPEVYIFQNMWINHLGKVFLFGPVWEEFPVLRIHVFREGLKEKKKKISGKAPDPPPPPKMIYAPWNDFCIKWVFWHLLDGFSPFGPGSELKRVPPPKNWKK